MHPGDGTVTAELTSGTNYRVYSNNQAANAPLEFVAYDGYNYIITANEVNDVCQKNIARELDHNYVPPSIEPPNLPGDASN